MTSDTFRRLALTMPETLEVGHMGHPDFRVGGKIRTALMAAWRNVAPAKLAKRVEVS